MIRFDKLEKVNRVLYLGPRGSYSELAKNVFVEKFNLTAEAVACESISHIINELKSSDKNDIAVIPIENSVEGMVRECLDNLYKLAKSGIRIFAETNIAVEHCLIGFAKDKIEIKELLSHPQALAQCRGYITKTLGSDVRQLPVMSTSQGVSLLEANNPSKAGIASLYSAKIYNVPVIDININDEKNNTTRFILLSNKKPLKTTDSKVSITFSTLNKSGALNKVLNVLEKYELNMSQINSRPSRKKLGEYVFYIDFNGHIDDAEVHMALEEILCYVTELEILSDGAIIV